MGEWEDSKLLTQWIFTVLLFVLFLIMFILMLVKENFRKIKYAKIKEEKTVLEHQQAILESNMLVQENERVRIAADIHDSLIGRLAILQLKNHLNTDKKETDLYIKQTIALARKISHDLSLPLIEDSSLEELINDVLQPWREIYVIKYISNIGSVAFSNEKKFHLTRILQELINNVYRHANATEIYIKAQFDAHKLYLHIRDNGCGFDLTEHNTGLGFKNIEYRVKKVGGNYRILSSDNGTRFLICIQNDSKN